MPKVEVETLSPVRRRLSVEVSRDQVSREIDRAYADLRRKAQVAGFRPGRAPRAVLERQFGDRVRSEVFSKLIQESLADAVRDHQLPVVGAPEIVTEHAEAGEDLRFNATVEVYPQVEVQGYSDLKLERTVVAVTDADVDRFLAALQESLAQLRPVEDRPGAERGDVVMIDYEARVAERVVGRADNRPCQIGSGSFPEAFEARLIGAAIGEVLEFPVTYPEEARHGELAGETVTFRVTVRGLALKETPPLDDEFAKDHGECETLAELRGRVRERLAAAATRRADESLRAAAVAALVARNEVEVPPSVIDRQTEAMMAEVAQGWRARRMWPKDEGAAFAALREELMPRARQEVAGALVLEAIAQQERIEVLDAEIEAEIEQAAADAGEGAERMRAWAARPEGRENLRERLRRRRALDLVLARAEVTSVESMRESVAGAPETR